MSEGAPTCVVILALVGGFTLFPTLIVMLSVVTFDTQERSAFWVVKSGTLSGSETFIGVGPQGVKPNCSLMYKTVDTPWKDVSDLFPSTARLFQECYFLLLTSTILVYLSSIHFCISFFTGGPCLKVSIFAAMSFVALVCEIVAIGYIRGTLISAMTTDWTSLQTIGNPGDYDENFFGCSHAGFIQACWQVSSSWSGSGTCKGRKLYWGPTDRFGAMVASFCLQVVLFFTVAPYYLLRE